jgi:sec-independent protein translocase protein TatA
VKPVHDRLKHYGAGDGPRKAYTMGSLGPTEIGVILVVGLLLFGAKRLPELGRSIGQGMREFRRSLSGLTEEPEKEENSTKTSDRPA